MHALISRPLTSGIGHLVTDMDMHDIIRWLDHACLLVSCNVWLVQATVQTIDRLIEEVKSDF